MPTGLLTMPVRLGLRGARIALGISERVVGMAWHTVESFVPGHDDGSGSTTERDRERPFPREHDANGSTNGRAETETDARAEDAVPRDPRAEFEREDRVRSRQPPPVPEVREPEEPEAVSSEAPSEPEHVDTDATLVESFAEPGAEDGAGAQIRIEEPWDGYSELSAGDVISRLEQASAAELAAVELFEAASRGRVTVISAVERQLKARSAGAQRSTSHQG